MLLLQSWAVLQQQAALGPEHPNLARPPHCRATRAQQDDGFVDAVVSAERRTHCAGQRHAPRHRL